MSNPSLPACAVLDAAEVAKPFRDELKLKVSSMIEKPLLVGFLGNDDPAARKYAKWTAKSCAEVGIRFELREVPRVELEDRIIDANADSSVHGIMVYYPCFGPSIDQYLQNVVAKEKDVEGLNFQFRYNMYHNIRFLDKEEKLKSTLPCTPLAVVKVLEHVAVYNPKLPFGNRLHGKHICVINRSEVVGRPLAAMLANDGAKVWSVDVDNVLIFSRGVGLKHRNHKVSESTQKLDEILPLCDVVISGVPSPSYKISTASLKEGVVAINFSSAENFEASVVERASFYIGSVGKVTVAMLERNLVRSVEYQLEQRTIASKVDK
ncbi:NAD(P)-binding protein [Gonapodya prolifera JEL478]|uniref:NAD(P)-binding protein n=1 Tax=Gonapodya prolifera (strain JEL478) TaxID=1344416 RepID=A0A139AV20_GONPJ|nr:NAD(P)-binding protein [Gonapodya prolifera JEL478]|eukprot:KXS20568.1 NAD(P)-binding protein [Gonapodya prolifera JEL478]